jgi:hypothetical protein
MENGSGAVDTMQQQGAQRRPVVKGEGVKPRKR